MVVLVKRFPRLSETFILNEFLELRRRGVPVEIFAVKDPGEHRSQPDALALVPEVTYLQAGGIWRCLPAALRTARSHPSGTARACWWTLIRHSRTALRNLLHALALLDRLAQGAPAHLHAHMLNAPAAIALIAHKVTGQPYSLSGHAKDIYTTLPENIILRCREARFVTTCTAANRTFMIETVGVSPANLHVCRHGVDMEKFAIPDARPHTGRILSIGRLVPKKGFDVLIRACGELHRRGIEFDLRIVGGGELHDDLLALAEQEGFPDRIRLIGSRSQTQLLDELAMAEVFALSPVIMPDGDRDGIPNVLMEAMAAGVPVVATAVSGIPELITDGVTGRLVPQRRPDLLAEVLADLLGEPVARRLLGQSGQRFVREQCSWNHAVTPLRDLLLGALAPAASCRTAVDRSLT